MQVQGHEVEVHVDDISFWPPNEITNGGMRIFWSGNIGFGTFDIFMDKDGQLSGDSESMCDNEDKEFLELLLKDLTSKIKILG